MHNPISKTLLFLFFVHCLFAAQAQVNTANEGTLLPSVPPTILNSLSKKAASTERSLDKSTKRYLTKLQKQERKLQVKMWKKDSVLARQLFEGLEEKYASLQKSSARLPGHHQVYSPWQDTLATALKFLKTNKGSQIELQQSLSCFTSMQDRFGQTEAVKQFLSERKQLLKELLTGTGLLKELKGFQKQAFYYSQQVQEYRQLWEDPSKLEKKLVELLLKTGTFKDFFRENSQLSSLFALPGGNTSTATLQGLQTRASVQQNIQDRFGSGPQVQQMIQENLRAAQGQLSELKNRLSQYGNGSFGNSTSDPEMPESFKLNTQKTKTFFQRLEYGANIQSQKARSYFPVTTDVGLSLGYKLNDNSSIGVGASYKLGWGRGWNNIRISHEGVGLRSYVDYKLKSSFYISGGFEQNYRTTFRNVQQLKNYSSWQSSGLLGMSKKYEMSKKFKGEMKLMWDFLSYQQVPRTQAVLFRIGYNLK